MTTTDVGGTLFGAVIEYRIKVNDIWQDRSVFLINKQHALTWLSEDWVKMTKKHDAMLMDIRIDYPVYYPDIDPIDVSGYEDPTNADMIYSVDFKSEKDKLLRSIDVNVLGTTLNYPIHLINS
jgi:hypothetical protein